MTETPTFDCLLATAMAAERNAARNYRDLAGLMTAHARHDIAAVFTRLAAEEARHDREVSDIAAHHGLDAAPAAVLRLPMWPHAQAPLLSHEAATDPATATPYRALAYAVDNEELAFGYYSLAATMASDERTRRLAEALAREELAHAALLRNLRRTAFHAGTRAAADEPLTRARDVRTLQDLLRAALALETALTTRLDADGAPCAALSAVTTETAATAAALRAALPAGDDHEVARGVLPATGSATGHEVTDAFEHAFAFYDAVVRHARDEALGQRAQALAASALTRLLMLRAVTRESTSG
ncbi:MAG: ferritin family protein [Gammaproteobacteria bacterium]